MGIMYWGQMFSFTSKISLVVLLFFSFLFQDLISLGLRGQIIPENLRLLLVWYIQAPNCPGYFYRFLWTEISVDMSFFCLSAFFFLPFSFIFCAHFSLTKIYSFSKYLAFTLPELCVVRMQTWIFIGYFILLFLASLSMIILPVQESSSTSFCMFPITSK